MTTEEWCPLCVDPDGAHLVGTQHTYRQGCVGKGRLESFAKDVLDVLAIQSGAQAVFGRPLDLSDEKAMRLIRDALSSYAWNSPKARAKVTR